MTLKLVTESLLTANNIDIQDVLISLDDLCSDNLDFADFYFQSRVYESWSLENRIIKEGHYHSD
ncbi:MAG: metalloprotease TldD, partial [Buchnera aphidicola]|nr:metalloprotease TldD [Buchnera aphidicola]